MAAISRRLGLRPAAPIAPAPIFPEPKPMPVPGAVIPATPVGPVTQQPPTAPGMLPQTAAAPVYDLSTVPAAPPAEEPMNGIGGVISRALIGFNKGASRVAIDPTYNPVGAGLVGGAESIGASQEDALNRRLAMAQAAQKPFLDAKSAAIKTQAEEQARKPFKDAENQAMLNRELELAKAKRALGSDPAEVERTGKNLLNLPLDQWSKALGRTSASRMDVFNWVSEHTDKPLWQIQREYDAGTAGAKAEAAGTGRVKGEKGQEIGATAASMEDMLTKAKPLMSSLDPATLRTYNAAVQAGQREFNDPTLLAVDVYLNSAAGFYAALLKNGGVPDVAETERAHKLLSSKLSVNGFAAVDKALRDEAASRVQRIKENQKPAAPAAPIAAPGKYAHLTDEQIKAALAGGH